MRWVVTGENPLPGPNETETMSGVSLPVTRASGRALVVGNPPSRAEPADTLRRMGYGCAEMDDPYAAMAELCRRPLVYRALVLSLASLHREELGIIPGVKRRFPHIDIWLTHTDGRQAALADAMRLGADGLLSGEGLHRVAVPAPGTGAVSFPATEAAPLPIQPERGAERNESQPATDDGAGPSEPVLSADELRALLQEQPAPPGAGGGELC
jgi:hypothetical protein